MSKLNTNGRCPQCGKLKDHQTRLCMDCHRNRPANSVQTLRNKRRVETIAVAMVELLQSTPKAPPVVEATSWVSPPVTYEPAVASEMLLNLETGRPIKVRVGPSTAQFVQCPTRAEGLAHHYQIDQDNHGVCSCGAERTWPRHDFAIGGGDDGAMIWR